jgi:hypothetical protein
MNVRDWQCNLNSYSYCFVFLEKSCQNIDADITKCAARNSCSRKEQIGFLS